VVLRKDSHAVVVTLGKLFLQMALSFVEVLLHSAGLALVVELLGLKLVLEALDAELLAIGRLFVASHLRCESSAHVIPLQLSHAHAFREKVLLSL
jgi:hypothetical protein